MSPRSLLVTVHVADAPAFKEFMERLSEIALMAQANDRFTAGEDIAADIEDAIEEFTRAALTQEEE